MPQTEFGRLTMLKLPGDQFVSLELVHDPEGGPVEPGGLHHLVITVEVVSATLERLAGRGVEADPPSSPDGSEDFWTAWLTDPDGYRVELVQWPAGHPAGMTRDDLTGPARTGAHLGRLAAQVVSRRMTIHPQHDHYRDDEG